MIEQKHTIIEIPVSDLLKKTEEYHTKGHRLVQIGCTNLGDRYEVNYTFTKSWDFESLRLTVNDGDVIPSISGTYWGAFIYENEIHDLFGLSVTDINVDFQGHLFETKIPAPFKNPPKVTKVPKGGDA
ncbi:NADH-quinone oxidoreductase subunit C [Methanogenium cariaci]|jgi:ech hydrogenase subunit D